MEEAEEEGESRGERLERRKKELREEKKKGNGWKDKRPEWEAPKGGDEGWSSKNQWNSRGL